MSCGALSLAMSAERSSLSARIEFTVLELGNKTVQRDLKPCSMKTTSKTGRTQTAMKFLIEKLLQSCGKKPDFLTLWNDADPDIQIVIAAKSEYAKLK